MYAPDVAHSQVSTNRHCATPLKHSCHIALCLRTSCDAAALQIVWIKRTAQTHLLCSLLDAVHDVPEVLAIHGCRVHAQARTACYWDSKLLSYV